MQYHKTGHTGCIVFWCCVVMSGLCAVYAKHSNSTSSCIDMVVYNTQLSQHALHTNTTLSTNPFAQVQATPEWAELVTTADDVRTASTALLAGIARPAPRAAGGGRRRAAAQLPVLDDSSSSGEDSSEEEESEEEEEVRVIECTVHVGRTTPCTRVLYCYTGGTSTCGDAAKATAHTCVKGGGGRGRGSTGKPVEQTCKCGHHQPSTQGAQQHTTWLKCICVCVVHMCCKYT